MQEPSTRDARRQAASEWRVRQADGLSVDEATAFQAWLSNPENAVAYEAADRAWASFDAANEADLVLLRRRVRSRVSKYNRSIAVRRFSGLAAALVIGLGGYGLYQARTNGALYVAAAETPREVRLADGSLIILDGGARVRAHLGGNSRDIELLEGQARFDVAHDPTRPFRVDVGAGVVQAVGTVFNIDRRSSEATVTLVQGAIDVFEDGHADAKPRRLRAGEQIHITSGTRTEPMVREVETQTATVWASGRMRFYDVALPDAVARMNRSADRPIILEGEGLKTLRVSGAFRYGDAEGFGRAAARLLDLELAERPDALVLQSSSE
ncbi:FecR family protein [Brevundimonas sp.]|jgi:transmembrane sensor|uniref:FecR family protein n=1 Tax=Brevundimonas sp. TaxID=1871086 RepID=UPI0037BF997A